MAVAEALVGSLTGHPWAVEKEKAKELSVPSLSSVPSTILQGEKGLCDHRQIFKKQYGY